MNKILLLMSLLLAFSFSACTDSDGDDTPIINVVGIFLNRDYDINYVSDLVEIPVLTKRDTLEVLMYLNGNGSDLRSFQVQPTDEEKSYLLKTILFFEINDISNELIFTDPENGRLGFIDGIQESGVTAKLCIQSSQEDEVEMGFYLFSKSKTEQGGAMKLLLQTGERVEETE